MAAHVRSGHSSSGCSSAGIWLCFDSTPIAGRIASCAEPVYLDASALAKLFVHEPESDDLNEALAGLTDVIVSDLALTEMASALGRRTREPCDRTRCGGCNCRHVRSAPTRPARKDCSRRLERERYDARTSRPTSGRSLDNSLPTRGIIEGTRFTVIDVSNGRETSFSSIVIRTCRPRIALSMGPPDACQMMNRIRTSRPSRTKYPLATISAYGPDNARATKLVVGILRRAGQKDTNPIRTWTTDAGDVRNDPVIAAELADWLRSQGIKDTLSYDRIIGCPHEEADRLSDRPYLSAVSLLGQHRSLYSRADFRACREDAAGPGVDRTGQG